MADLLAKDAKLLNEKRIIRSKLRKQRIIIQEYELNHSATDQISELKWYQQQNKLVETLLEKLYQLRLEGGAFVLYPTNRIMSLLALKSVKAGNGGVPVVMRVSSMGEMSIMDYSSYNTMEDHVARTEYIDQLDMVRITGEEVESEDEDEDDDVVLNNEYRIFKHTAPNSRTVRLDWKDGRSSWFIAPEAKEFVEVIGAHMRHFNHKKIQNIRCLKRLYEMKLVHCENDAEKALENGTKLLRRLWNAVFDDDACPDNDEDLLNNVRWKDIGFQNSKPFTDFRAMGLLGLWCIVYLAERSLGVHRPRLSVSSSKDAYFQNKDFLSRRGWVQLLASTDSRPYPFAAACVNIISLLVHDLLQLDTLTATSPASDPRWSSALLSFLAYLEPVTFSEDGDSALRRVSAFNIYSTVDNMRNLLTPPTRHHHMLTGLEEFFCFSMELLDRIYIRTKAGYMDFPLIMKQVQTKLNEYLRPRQKERPISIEALWGRLEQEFPVE